MLAVNAGPPYPVATSCAGVEIPRHLAWGTKLALRVIEYHEPGLRDPEGPCECAERFVDTIPGLVGRPTQNPAARPFRKTFVLGGIAYEREMLDPAAGTGLDRRTERMLEESVRTGLRHNECQDDGRARGL